MCHGMVSDGGAPQAPSREQRAITSIFKKVVQWTVASPPRLGCGLFKMNNRTNKTSSFLHLIARDPLFGGSRTEWLHGRTT